MAVAPAPNVIAPPKCHLAKTRGISKQLKGYVIRSADGLRQLSIEIRLPTRSTFCGARASAITDLVSSSFGSRKLAGDQQRLRYHDAHLPAHDLEQDPHSAVIIEILEFADEVGKGASGHSDCLPCPQVKIELHIAF